MMLMMLACISTCEPSSQHLTGQKPDDKHLLDITPWHLSKQKPYHKHLRAIIAAYVKTKTLPQAPARHHRGICQDKNFTLTTCEPSPPHLSRQKPYHKHLRAITATVVKTKTLPQAPASHHRITPPVVKIKTLPQALESHPRGICQHKNLTKSTCEPSSRHLSRQNPPQAPASHHRGISQDKNLTTSTCEPSLRHLSRQKTYHKHLRAIAAAVVKTKNLPQAPASRYHCICQDRNLTTNTCEP